MRDKENIFLNLRICSKKSSNSIYWLNLIINYVILMQFIIIIKYKR